MSPSSARRLTFCHKKYVRARFNVCPTLSSTPHFIYLHATMLNNIESIKSCFALKINLRLKEMKEFWISFNINGKRWIFQLTNTSSRWKLLLPTKHCSCRYCNSSLSTSLPAVYIVRHCITLDAHILFCRSASQSHLPSSQRYALESKRRNLGLHWNNQQFFHFPDIDSMTSQTGTCYTARQNLQLYSW